MSLDPLDLSVIVINWNTRGLLANCLASLPAATAGLRTEIIVVDNASSDGSVEMLRECFPGVRTIASERNLGYSGGANLAFKEAAGRCVAVLNPDVVAHPDSLTRLVELLSENRPRAGLAGPEVVQSDGRPLVQDFRLPGIGAALARLPGVPRLRALGSKLVRRRREPRCRRVERVNGCAMVFRRAALEAVGGLPEHNFLYGEETLIGHVMRQGGFEVWYQPASRVVHLDGGAVGQRWDDRQRQMIFKLARLIAAYHVLPGGRFLAWNLVMIVREALTWALRPARALGGRPASQVPLGEIIGCHLQGMLATFRPARFESVVAAYESYAR